MKTVSRIGTDRRRSVRFPGVGRIAALALALTAVLGACARAPSEDPAGMDWDRVLQEAKGTEVRFHMWGGDARINAWIDGFVARELSARYGVKVVRVPMDAPVRAVRRPALPTVLAAVLVSAVLAAVPAAAQAPGTGPGLSEDFADLSAWIPLDFPKIPRKSAYRLVEAEGRTLLEARSDASASGLVRTGTFDVYETPVLEFSWRLESGPSASPSPRTKAGDDYPLRVYVIFEYDPKSAPLGMRMMYETARVLYKEYPPHSSLNYAWSVPGDPGGWFRSPYTDRSAMLVTDSGLSFPGEFRVRTRDLLDDYRAAFGTDPPKKATVAVMADSDNAGGTSLGYLDFLRVKRR